MTQPSRILNLASRANTGLCMTALLCLLPFAGHADSLLTAAGAANFSGESTLDGIDLHEIDFASAVVLNSSRAKAGHLVATISSTPPVVEIEIQAAITQATVDLQGVATLVGAATVTSGGVDTGQSVPFAATVTVDSLSITLDGQTLPTVAVEPGDISID